MHYVSCKDCVWIFQPETANVSSLSYLPFNKFAIDLMDNGFGVSWLPH